MMFQNTIKSLLCNFKSVYKVLLYKIIVTLIIIALAVALFLPQLKPVYSDMSDLGINEDVQDFFSTYSASEYSDKEAKENLDVIVEMTKDVLRNNAKALMNVYISLIILAIVSYFFRELVNLPLVEMLHGSMQSQAKYSFTGILLSNFKKSLLYALVATLIILPLDILTVFTVLSILFSAQGVFVYFAPFNAILIGIVMITLRVTLTIGWLPSMVIEEKGVFSALGNSIKLLKNKFWKVFGTVSMLILIFITIAGACFVFTMGVGGIIIPSIIIVTMRIFELVFYFNKVGKRYYVNFNEIVTPNSVKEDEEQSFSFDLNND